LLKKLLPNISFNFNQKIKLALKKEKTQNNKVSEMQRLRKFFSYFRKGCFKTILIKNKSNALIVKLSQNLRIKRFRLLNLKQT
jgi:hypothetical protein